MHAVSIRKALQLWLVSGRKFRFHKDLISTLTLGIDHCCRFVISCVFSQTSIVSLAACLKTRSYTLPFQPKLFFVCSVLSIHTGCPSSRTESFLAKLPPHLGAHPTRSPNLSGTQACPTGRLLRGADAECESWLGKRYHPNVTPSAVFWKNIRCLKWWCNASERGGEVEIKLGGKADEEGTTGKPSVNRTCIVCTCPAAREN